MTSISRNLPHHHHRPPSSLPHLTSLPHLLGVSATTTMPPPPTAFLPTPALPTRLIHPHTPPTCSAAPSPSHPTRRHVLTFTLATLLLPSPLPALSATPAPTPTAQPSSSSSSSSTPAPKVTDRVYLDISIAGTPRGRLTLGLYGTLSPAAVSVFKQLATDSLRDRRGRTAGYRYSQAAKVFPGQAVELGRIQQNDPLNQTPGLPARQLVGVSAPPLAERNALVHDRGGLVSVKKGGGFEFLVGAEECRLWDDDWLVVGEVLDGVDLLQRMVRVPVNRKTIRDGYRSVGRAIGDARANVDVRCKLLGTRVELGVQ